MNRADLIEQAWRAEAEGDSLTYEGDLAGAKASFGVAIDRYVQARSFSDAVRTCRKVIRVAPDVARARFTLIFLLAGMGQPEQALAELPAYADAVRASDARGYAAAHLRLLEHATDDRSLTSAVSELAAELGMDSPGVSAKAVDGSTAKERWEALLLGVLIDARE